MKKAILIFLLTSLIMFSLLPTAVFADGADGYETKYPKPFETEPIETIPTETEPTEDDGPTEIDDQTTDWSGQMIAVGETGIIGSVVLKGDAELVLTNGAKLTVNSTIDCSGHVLTVSAQSDGENAGMLTVKVKSSLFPSKDTKIDSAPNGEAVKGDIIVNGGIVTLAGADAYSTSYGSGDVAASGVGVKGNVTVNGGTVVITGGGSDFGTADGSDGIKGNLTVSGNGKVTVNGGNGKNGGIGVNGYSITLNDNADVTVTGGNGSFEGKAGDAITCSWITVNGGAALLTGGQGSGFVREPNGWGFAGDPNDINAKIMVSENGTDFIEYEPNGAAMSEHFYSVRLTPKQTNVADTTETKAADDTKTEAAEKDMAVKPTSPQTGDDFAPVVIVMMIVSLAFCIGVCTRSNKNSMN